MMKRELSLKGVFDRPGWSDRGAVEHVTTWRENSREVI